MKITILTGTDELNLSLARYIRFTLPEAKEIFIAQLGNPETLEQAMFSSDIWIAEAFNPSDYQNPEGFRTAKKLAGKNRFLLLFTSGVCENIPEEGRFWIKLPTNISLASKIRRLLKDLPPSKDDYLSLEEKWPLLKETPFHHHPARQTGELII